MSEQRNLGVTAMTGSDPRVVRAARQALRTSAMMGVDFVPLRAGAGEGWAAEVAGEDSRQSESPTKGALSASSGGKVAAQAGQGGASAGAAGSSVGASVVRPRPSVTPTAPPPAAPEPSLSEPTIVEPKPRVLSDKQQQVQARLDALRAKYEKDAPHSTFVTDHHCIVFGDGDPCARLMIIGEAPGAEEDRVGLPFVGRAGQLLEKMLGGMGLKRSDVYITNVLKTRPPDNATPTADEAAACAPYLFEQIKIIGPEAILALGLPATRVLLNTMDSMGRLRGRWSTYTDPRTIGYEVPVMPTYHPAFLLRSYTRENREKVWADLKMVMERLGLKAGTNAGVGGAGA